MPRRRQDCRPSSISPPTWAWRRGAGGWSSFEASAPVEPPLIDAIVAKVMEGGRVSAGEALQLYREAPTHLLGSLANALRVRKHPEGVVTYIIDRNVNYTNICVARCNFCAFYRPVGSGEGYVLG